MSNIITYFRRSQRPQNTQPEGQSTKPTLKSLENHKTTSETSSRSRFKNFFSRGKSRNRTDTDRKPLLANTGKEEGSKKSRFPRLSQPFSSSFKKIFRLPKIFSRKAEAKTPQNPNRVADAPPQLSKTKITKKATQKIVSQSQNEVKTLNEKADKTWKLYKSTSTTLTKEVQTCCQRHFDVVLRVLERHNKEQILTPEDREEALACLKDIDALVAEDPAKPLEVEITEGNFLKLKHQVESIQETYQDRLSTLTEEEKNRYDEHCEAIGLLFDQKSLKMVLNNEQKVLTHLKAIEALFHPILLADPTNLLEVLETEVNGRDFVRLKYQVRETIQKYAPTESTLTREKAARYQEHDEAINLLLEESIRLKDLTPGNKQKVLTHLAALESLFQSNAT